MFSITQATLPSKVEHWSMDGHTLCSLPLLSTVHSSIGVSVIANKGSRCMQSPGFPAACRGEHLAMADLCLTCAGLLKAGRTAAASAKTLQQCLQAAMLRHKELSTVLSQSLQAAGLPSHDR